MRILGIETSCDETAAAVVDERGLVLSDVVHSQVDLHATYGGVIPELASRDHLRNVVPVVDAALERAGLSLADVDGVAVTCRPGLVGALLVGTSYAKALTFAAGKPLVGVDHLVGHLLSPRLRRPAEGGVDAALARPVPEFPYVALLVSGGHSSIWRVDGPLAEQATELGGTRDDAAGEAFDKVGKLLGLGYPGGPVVDRLARDGDPARFPLVVPMASSKTAEMSFSGLKTQVAKLVAELGPGRDEQATRDVCASFQTRLVDVLAKKLVAAAEREGVPCVTLGGGVAANSALRARVTALAEARGLVAFVPDRASTTDNAAMIALAGLARLARGERDDATLGASSKTALVRRTRKGRGVR